MPNLSDSASAAHPPLIAQRIEASLTTADVARSRDWYRAVLGFTVDREYSRDGRMFAVAMAAGATRILLTQDDGAKGPGRSKGEGFSLMITTEQDIDAIAAFAKHAGAALEAEPVDMRGARFFRLRDPDGFRWTVSSPREGR